MTLYNKIFTKILDSSIWLESTTTRLVWLTFIAAMDEDGFVQFASVSNLAHRARVTKDEAQKAVECLESPDPDSSDPDHEGRRIERVPGGWMILNAAKYRELVTRTVSKEQNRLRVARHRENKRVGNGHVTVDNGSVTPSEADTDTRSEAETIAEAPSTSPPLAEVFKAVWNALPEPFKQIRSMSEDRKSALKTRLKDDFWRINWKEAISLMPKTPFMAGMNDRQWVADVDYFLRPGSVAKIMEGKYDGPSASHSRNGLTEDFSHLVPQDE